MENEATASIRVIVFKNGFYLCSGAVGVATEKGKASFIALAKAFFAGGGQQYTITVVSPEDLIDAKAHPENHKNLIVRVGGYSDYFTNLPEELQDNVIKRSFM